MAKKIILPQVQFDMLGYAFEYLKMDPADWVKVMNERSQYKGFTESDYYPFIVGYVTPVIRDILSITKGED